MKSSWEAGAIGTPPPAPSSFSNGYPTEGDPSTAVPPTLPGAYWFYMVTQEIVNAITAAGLTPSTSTLNQLTTAIAALSAVLSVNGRTGAVTGVVDTAAFTGSNQSLATPGYQKLPGGLILQWGTTSVTNGSTATFTFPVAFPTACVFADVQFATNPYAGATTEGVLTVNSKSASNCVIGNQFTGDTTGTLLTASGQVFAIGY